jgi:hypothetical protein
MLCKYYVVKSFEDQKKKRGHPQARERREISGGRSTTSKEAPTSGEEGRHRRKGNHDQRCYV